MEGPHDPEKGKFALPPPQHGLQGREEEPPLSRDRWLPPTAPSLLGEGSKFLKFPDFGAPGSPAG